MSSEYNTIDVNTAYFISIIKNNKTFLEHVGHAQNSEPTIVYLLEFLKNVFNLFEEILSSTGEEDKEILQKIRAAYHRNEFYKERIDFFTQQDEKIELELGGVLKKQTEVLNKCKLEIEAAKKANKKLMEEKMKQTLKIMSDQTQISEEKQENLQHDLESVKVEYANLLTSHIELEKKLRAKRSKAEAQLSSWITKYDTDITEKHLEFEKLSEQLEELESIYTKLEDDAIEQEPLYEQCVEEKETEEEEVHNQCSIVFLLNRSARRIQKYWRLYYSKINRHGKKKK